MESSEEHAASAGEVVRLRREELGLSKAELARRARLTRSSIHEIEADQRRHLQTRTLRSLEEALALAPGSLSPTSRQRDTALAASLSRELEGLLSENRYNDLLQMIMRVANRVDELEHGVNRQAS